MSKTCEEQGTHFDIARCTAELTYSNIKEERRIKKRLSMVAFVQTESSTLIVTDKTHIKLLPLNLFLIVVLIFLSHLMRQRKLDVRI